MTDDRQLLQLLFDAAVTATSPAACVPLWLEDKPKGRVIIVGAGKACLLYTSDAADDAMNV